jgi:hypothetical protein
LKSKLSGGCAICLFASDEPACCCSPSPLSCSCASCSLSANFLSLSHYLSRLAEPHLILVCEVALSLSLVIISLSLSMGSLFGGDTPQGFEYLYFFIFFFSFSPHSYHLSHRLFFPICAFDWFFFVLVNTKCQTFSPRRLRFLR